MAAWAAPSSPAGSYVNPAPSRALIPVAATSLLLLSMAARGHPPPVMSLRSLRHKRLGRAGALACMKTVKLPALCPARIQRLSPAILPPHLHGHTRALLTCTYSLRHAASVGQSHQKYHMVPLSKPTARASSVSVPWSTMSLQFSGCPSGRGAACCREIAR